MENNPFNLKEAPSPNSFDLEKRLSSLEALIGIVYTPIGEGHAISSKMAKKIMKHIKHEHKSNADSFVYLKKYLDNLEKLIQQLDQTIKSERKNTKRIDSKLRHRIQMLESQVDMMENNHPNFVACKEKDLFDKHNPMQKVDGGYFWEIKEKQKDKDIPFKSSPYCNYKPTLPNTKVAIRVENEEEFNELMAIMDNKLWKWCDNEKFKGTSYFSQCEEGGRVCVYFNDDASWFYENDESSVYIIPLNILKIILGA